MKKFFLSITIVFLFAATSLVDAQTNLSFGPTVALNFASFNGKDAPSGTSAKTGMAIGGFMNYQFSDMFSLQPELLFSMKGSSGATGGVNYTFTTNYIEVPVLLKLYIPLAGKTPVKPMLYAGPAFAFNVASSVEASANGQTANQDLKNQTKGFDLGLAFGGGVGFKVGTGELAFSLRYTLGLTTTDNSGGNATVTNGVFAIVAGYAFQ